jgi:unspecific monooxygenase
MYQARRNADVERQAEAAAGEFADFMRGIIAERRKVPQNDFISQLVAFQRSGDLSEEELLSTAILLLNAGHEATAHTLGNAVPLLLDFTGRVEALAPGSIAGTVEECLRFRPPLHLFTRQVYQPVTVAGVPLQPGNTIGCLLASACRDDAVWPDGEKFDPFRIQHRHTAFGVGLHSCLGAALARLELQIGLPVLFARCPDLTIVEPPRVANLYHFHGYEAMQVTVRQAPPQST